MYEVLIAKSQQLGIRTNLRRSLKKHPAFELVATCFEYETVMITTANIQMARSTQKQKQK